MRCSFHPAAQAELEAAVEYYEEKEPGLGIEFAEEVHKSVLRIIENPAAWSRLSKHTRRCIISRFPYGIIYQLIEGEDLAKNEILIVAVMHLHRRPDYYQKRLTSKTVISQHGKARR